MLNGLAKRLGEIGKEIWRGRQRDLVIANIGPNGIEIWQK
jgi:hypothetical protein